MAWSAFTGPYSTATPRSPESFFLGEVPTMHPEKASSRDVLNLSTNHLVRRTVKDGYRRPWNARSDAGKLAKGIPKEVTWAYESGGLNQIGCVYTAQGFEFDYVGVIFGKDLVYDLDGQKWIGVKDESHDSEVKRSGPMFTDLVKNTYRVLLTRGMRGCYVCFLDKDTERFVRSRMDARTL
jgi:hypothetical protein